MREGADLFSVSQCLRGKLYALKGAKGQQGLGENNF